MAMDILTRETYLNGTDVVAVPRGKEADEVASPLEVEDTCLLALTTAYNAREEEGGSTKRELLQFVEECFNVPPDRLQLLKQKARTIDKPELNLMCKVLHATGLTAKDANGLSDPYCKLGILNEIYREKQTVKHKDLEVWQNNNIVDCVAGTRVKLATLEPEWNETFYLSVADPNKDMLVLEVWDSDEPTETGSMKIKGIRGLGTYIAEKTIMKGDDFMGRLFYPLRSIPNSGEEKTFPLHSHSGKNQHGCITLQLDVVAKKKQVPLQKRLSEFSALTRALVEFSSRQDGKYMYVKRWDAQLPPMAEKLLEHHAILNNVDAIQRAYIRLSVLIKHHKLHVVNMKVLCDLIRTIREHRSVLSITTDEDDWKHQLFEDLNELMEDTEDVLKDHLCLFNITKPSNVAMIEERVKTLCELFSLGAFTQQLPPGNDSLKGILEKSISVAVAKWFRVLNANLLPDADTEKKELATFVELAEHCLDMCQKTFKVLNPIFMEAGVDYFSFFYVAMDELICEEATAKLQGCRDSTDLSTFAIYGSFKEIAKMLKYVNKSMVDGLSLPHFHKWFKDMVRNWISIAMQRCKDYTVKAIAADSAITVTSEVMISPSAVDATGFLLSVGTFWKNLEWPVASVAYGHAVSVMEAISECALFYVEEVFKKLNREDILDGEGRFRVTEKLCIVLNNMQHIRQELSKLEETLELRSFYAWLEKEEKVGKRCKQLVRNLLESADEDIYNRMDKVILEITKQLSPDIKMFVHNFITEDRDINDEKAMDPLLEFLHRNLQTFSSNLYPAVLKINFLNIHRLANLVDQTTPFRMLVMQYIQRCGEGVVCILCDMWQVSVESVEKSLEEAPSKKGTDSAQLHQRLRANLETMRDFYHCGGEGLQEKELDSEHYKKLCSKLDILCLPTDELILHFFSDLSKCQQDELEAGRTDFGTLLLSVGYLKEKSVVEVDIIEGKRLPGLDKSGLSDPFVQLTLMPKWAFSQTSSKSVKTSVQKQTLDPFFNESFKLPAKRSEMDKVGAVLLLSVFDHDIVGANDFAGMCVVSCKDIPRLASAQASLTDPRAAQRKNLTLPLFRCYKETLAFRELDVRSHLGDAKANDFFKMSKNQNFLGDLSLLRHRTSLFESISISKQSK